MVRKLFSETIHVKEQRSKQATQCQPRTFYSQDKK